MVPLRQAGGAPTGRPFTIRHNMGTCTCERVPKNGSHLERPKLHDFITENGTFPKTNNFRPNPQPVGFIQLISV
jgi:hypothetical protein